MGEHAVGKLPAELEQARPFRSFGQQRARADRVPALDKNRRKPVELGPQRFLAACGKIDVSAERYGNAELGRAQVLRNIEIPRQYPAECAILPKFSICRDRSWV